MAERGRVPVAAANGGVRRARWLQTFSYATVLIAAAALGLLAWQNLVEARALERERLQSSLLRAQERVRVLVQAAEMTAHSARRAAVVQPLSADSLQPILQSLVAAFEQRPELSYLGLAVAASGDYAYLERSANDGISLWIYPPPDAADRRVRGLQYTAGGWQPRAQEQIDAYDPRTRPFYQAALSAGEAGTWMPAYRWISRDPAAAPVWGLSHVAAVRAPDGRLLGVVDADLHLPALNQFVRGLGREYNVDLQLVEHHETSRVLAGARVGHAPMALAPGLADVLSLDPAITVSAVQTAAGPQWLAQRRIAPGPGLNWTLLAARPVSALPAQLRQQAVQLAIIAVLLAAGSLLVLARFRAERRLRQERDYAAALLEALPGVFHHYDQGLALRRWNRSLERVTGYTSGELQGMTPFQFVPESQHAALRDGIANVFDAGAFSLQTDYVLKDGTQVPYLLTGVPLRLAGKPGFVSLGTDVSELKQAQQRVLYLATHDPLTGLPNRNLLLQRMHAAIAVARAKGSAVALLLVDVDRFKLANDGGGYAFGDGVLRAVGQRLRDAVGERGVVARQGGDEFLLLLDHLPHVDDAAAQARQVLDALREPLQVAGRAVPVEASAGLSVFPQDGEAIETLIGNADLAMYRAKAQGGNQVQAFNRAMSDHALERVQLEAGLRTAVQNGELALHYQPKVRLSDGCISGCEALLRWQHPQLGNVSPARFIPVAEASGLIVAIGDWVLRSACRQAVLWSQAGLQGACVAVNLSARQFQQQDVVAWVADVLASTGLPPALLELELTESLIAQDMTRVVEAMDRLRALGVRIAIDDFGTGYSSLGYLKHFHVDTLKVDRSFIEGLLSDPREASIATATISLAHSLGFLVVAEGVECEAQRDFLAAHGCDQVQGYLYSRPVPAAAMEQLLRDDASRARAPLTPG